MKKSVRFLGGARFIILIWWAALLKSRHFHVKDLRVGLYYYIFLHTCFTLQVFISYICLSQKHYISSTNALKTESPFIMSDQNCYYGFIALYTE